MERWRCYRREEGENVGGLRTGRMIEGRGRRNRHWEGVMYEE